MLQSKRDVAGQYQTIMSDLRRDNKEFFNYYRMSQSSFDELLAMLSPYIQKQDTTIRDAICPEQRLAMPRVTTSMVIN